MQQYTEEVIESKNPKRKKYEEQHIIRVGQTKRNRQGSLMCVDLYNNANEIYVRFIESGYIVKSTYFAFIQGNIKDRYFPEVYGKGFIGEGYKSIENGIPTRVYKIWVSMLQRCYSEKFKERNPSYKGVEVAPEFLSFQSFAKWYNDNYYEIEGERMSLDKDILVKNCKLYSPQTTIIVPQFINSLFTFSDKVRSDLPIGVRPNGNKFKATANIKVNGKRGKKHLGSFNSPEEAFNAYKEYKEDFFRSVAEEYRGKIPEKVYRAIRDYKIEITD